MQWNHRDAWFQKPRNKNDFLRSFDSISQLSVPPAIVVVRERAGIDDSSGVNQSSHQTKKLLRFRPGDWQA
ncbi:hypothetical protein CEE69_02030 [Rhodopirellula bahusiensis]|uniref:Uncharacterized protein n=1 Tax=Rhodopirellula bahusiensis TaxID=2014065 RepID=A0A2G1WDM3_9BACT|nr:hypothetical protein CEE69_02030 [Rhodopirellula bahusiensis]